MITDQVYKADVFNGFFGDFPIFFGDLSKVLHAPMPGMLVSLAVEEGELIGLLGRNGAGKTTLLRAIMGVVTPGAGRVLVDGADMAGAQKTNAISIDQVAASCLTSLLSELQ